MIEHRTLLLATKGQNMVAITFYFGIAFSGHFNVIYGLAIRLTKTQVILSLKKFINKTMRMGYWWAWGQDGCLWTETRSRSTKTQIDRFGVVNKRFIIWHAWEGSDSQSQQRILFILPAGASYIVTRIRWVIYVNKSSLQHQQTLKKITKKLKYVLINAKT